MSETKWTPGPWRVGTPGPNGCYTVGTKAGLMTAMVAHSIHEPDQAEQATANARLIAAAPELYSVIERWLAVEDGPIVGPEFRVALRDAQNAARAALAKVRGEA